MNRTNTSDPEELDKFNQLAETWWNQDGPMWPLHKLNDFRVEIILQQLRAIGKISDSNKPLTGLTVLDVGCGGGILSESLAEMGAIVTGIDLASRNIEIARQHASQNHLSIDYKLGEVYELQENFDLVFNMEVVEHVANLKTFMLELNHMVKPGGIMFVSTINRTFKSFLFAIIGAEYILRILPKGTHSWHKFVEPDVINLYLAQGGLKPFWNAGVTMNPFSKRFYLTRSLAVNYMLAATKPIA